MNEALKADIEALTELLSTSIVMVLTSSVTLIGIVIVMVALEWRMALLSLATVPIMVISTIYFRTKIRDASNNYHRLVAELLAYINEQFSGMLIVQLFGRQRVSRAEFAELNQVSVRFRIDHGAFHVMQHPVGMRRRFRGIRNDVLPIRDLFVQPIERRTDLGRGISLLRKDAEIDVVDGDVVP